MSTPLLKVENVTKSFPIFGGIFSREVASVKAVQGVSFEIKKGETLGLGGRIRLRKIHPGSLLDSLARYDLRENLYNGKDITHIKGEELREMRRKIQIIFQDPFASLNPRMTIGAILEEPLIIHNLYNSAQERQKRVNELIDLVGLRREHLNRYPHEFSGGQRQARGNCSRLGSES